MNRIGSIFIFLTALTSGIAGNETPYWKKVNENAILVAGKRQIVPNKYITLSLNGTLLKEKLWAAPKENSVNIDQSDCIIELPIANGSMQSFKVVEASIMEPALAKAYPHIRTFSIKGIDDPYASGKLDWNDFGFHGMIRSIHGDVFIDPYCLGNTTDYISYYTKDFIKDPKDILPETILADQHQKKLSNPTIAVAPCVGNILRTYRLAVACTGEYAVAATGSATPTKAQTLSKVVTTVNRIDGVYETETSVRMILVANDTLVLYTNAGTDPFSGNNNAITLIGESSTVINANIGAANFDIGHTFGTGVGGLATLGVVCSVDKAEGVTGSPTPVGDPFDIDYVAHEIGHQFNAEHTFNSVISVCNGNRTAATAVEPGSGVTIMAYAGLCGTDDIGTNSIPYFHAVSYDDIVNFVVSGAGSACAATSGTGNNPPVVTGPATYTIPFSTPFTLTGSATDPNNDLMTYSWEETDPGISGGPWNSGNSPYFMSYVPIINPSRTFPKVSVILSGNMTGTKGEYLPANPQTLNFRLTARDNKMGGGGVCSANSQVVIAADGPFSVTYPSVAAITWSAGATQTVSWSVNNTSVTPVSCASVNILISLDGGTTFNILVPNTPNDGSEIVTVPSLTLTNNACRIKVAAIGNIFFDISDNNFTISAGDNIKEIFSKNIFSLKASPNPVNESVNISAVNLDPSDESVLTITDILGRTVKTDQFRSDHLFKSYNLENMDAGIYFITLINDNYHSVVRIIKQ